MSVIRLLFKYSSMISYDLAHAVYPFGESVKDELDSLIESGHHVPLPSQYFVRDRYYLTDKGWMTDKYGEDIGWRLQVAEMTGRLLEDV